MLSISVVIPTRNEAAHVGATLDAVLRGDVAEVIVADCGSDDDTAALAAQRGVKVVTSSAGRGTQQNAGAQAASGDVLLFVHADTALPAGFDDEVRRLLDDRDVAAGAFRLAIDTPGRLYRVVEALANWRSRFLSAPYGDQAIFLRRGVFDAVGGFPDAPLMEDVALLRKLRRRGRIAISPLSVTTSARRWTRYGAIRTTLLNQVCLAAYWLGVRPARIAAWRNGC